MVRRDLRRRADLREHEYGSQAQYGGELAARCRWDREVHLVTEAADHA